MFTVRNVALFAISRAFARKTPLSQAKVCRPLIVARGTSPTMYRLKRADRKGKLIARTN
jgi:hypothetical protein